MKTSPKFYLVLVLLVATALMLGACGGSSASTPAPATTAASTTKAATTTVAATTAAPVTTAVATTVATTTAPATTVAAAPTLPKTTTAAAAITTVAVASGTNTVTGLGITISFPAGWNTNVEDKADEGVLSGTNSAGDYITIYRFTKGKAVQGDLMTRAGNLVDNLKNSYPDLAVLEPPTQVSADTVRLGIEYTAKTTNTLNVEIVLVIDDASLKGTYLVEAGAQKANFTEQKKASLVAILNTIKTNPTAVGGSQPTPAATGKDNKVSGLGINLTFPAEWQTQVNEKPGEGSILSLSPQGSHINIFRFTKGGLVEGSLKDRASAVVDYLKSLYPDLKVLEEPNEISSDTARFSAQYTDPTRKNNNVEVVLVIDDATLNATYLVEAGSDKSNFDKQKDVLVNILNTLKTS